MSTHLRKQRKAILLLALLCNDKNNTNDEDDDNNKNENDDDDIMNNSNKKYYRKPATKSTHFREQRKAILLLALRSKNHNINNNNDEDDDDDKNDDDITNNSNKVLYRKPATKSTHLREQRKTILRPPTVQRLLRYTRMSSSCARHCVRSLHKDICQPSLRSRWALHKTERPQTGPPNNMCSSRLAVCVTAFGQSVRAVQANKGSARSFGLVGFMAACLTSQQHASVSQGRICSDNFTRCHTEREAAHQTLSHPGHSTLKPGRPVPELIL